VVAVKHFSCTGSSRDKDSKTVDKKLHGTTYLCVILLPDISNETLGCAAKHSNLIIIPKSYPHCRSFEPFCTDFFLKLLIVQIIAPKECFCQSFMRALAEMVERMYELKPQKVELKTYKQAQNAPTPYVVFAVTYDGQLLADHQMSAGRFRNIMKKIQG
jgi:hypothetical protein